MTLKGIVTTSGRTSHKVMVKAERIANEWGLPFERRHKRSINLLKTTFNTTIYVVSNERIEAYHPHADDPLFFHPNNAMFRAKHWMKHGNDPLIDACHLQKGDHVVDATLGLGADAQLASMAVGASGKVIALEASQVISLIVKEGFSSYMSSFMPLNDAMRRITVLHCSHLEWLLKQPDDSVDVIYFDPMFEYKVNDAAGISPLRTYANYDSLTHTVIQEAVRVARKRVILKDHFRSERFEAFGFNVQKRPSATYQFGSIECQKRVE
ncbi:class I SAM-dependent methyltransferase [Salipaludibacillus agaradhaerens]|uniref:Class I SAM-dependent methyltransferase n=1 Tax=Salipaludibacillus agaradhaerens TaxID=76935 RepID=A0A9Q4B0I6_SALAG|nr:class I SAM-dependent methyltransferase [Salipaludibacillus agaradhaerens]MCR6096126.1 class I SAM-dependent methyltransferase [Salipaludibacillus agaradhaerens]MCR6114315.1 class I SAM-dependent methyltransferase [Salipaludibacillus agaradhaerens]